MKEKNLALKATEKKDFEEENITLMMKMFQRILRKGQTSQRRQSQKTTYKDLREQLCYKCGSPDHFINLCPLWTLKYKKNNPERTKEVRSDQYIPTNRRITNQKADMTVKKAFAAMENSSREESDGTKAENQSLLAMKGEREYDFLSLVAIAESDDEENHDQAKNTILALMDETDSEEDE
ncbi:uncharacterized protein LOC129893151 [Solanum dulcamara]|uniref:uncharacterized protein LOC129893151 n=1 Tax=Solanum dulcamara TaxID=45834 RepID=UPI002484F1DC|nr:uncharacterized protein LOC129893151 [Solanum dulcamara]